MTFLTPCRLAWLASRALLDLAGSICRCERNADPSEARRERASARGTCLATSALAAPDARSSLAVSLPPSPCTQATLPTRSGPSTMVAPSPGPVYSLLHALPIPSLPRTIEHWIPGQTPLSTTPEVVVAVAVYLAVIFGGQALMRGSKPYREFGVSSTKKLGLVQEQRVGGVGLEMQTRQWDAWGMESLGRAAKGLLDDENAFRSRFNRSRSRHRRADELACPGGASPTRTRTCRAHRN